MVDLFIFNILKLFVLKATFANYKTDLTQATNRIILGSFNKTILSHCEKLD